MIRKEVVQGDNLLPLVATPFFVSLDDDDGRYTGSSIHPG